MIPTQETLEKTAIGVFCYKRPGKLKESIEALLKNPECAAMDIVFFCDGHKSEKDLPGVLATREYINSITGFKKIYKHFRERNVSTGPNFQAGLAYLCDNYEQFIIVEDDLVVTPNYITYLLQALDEYRDDKSVFCATGFCFPIDVKDYPYDSIVHRRFCSYGWGSWSNRVKNVQWDKEYLAKVMRRPGFTAHLNKEGKDLPRLVDKQVRGAISTWDIQMQVYVAANNLKVIYPIISKGYNIGFDSESTNTFGLNYLKTTLDEGYQHEFNMCPADEEVLYLQRQLRKPYSFPALASRKIINTMIKLTT